MWHRGLFHAGTWESGMWKSGQTAPKSMSTPIIDFGSGVIEYEYICKSIDDWLDWLKLDEPQPFVVDWDSPEFKQIKAHLWSAITYYRVMVGQSDK